MKKLLKGMTEINRNITSAKRVHYEDQIDNGWRNCAYDVYKKECGREVFEEKLKKFTKPPPAPGRLSSFKFHNISLPAMKTTTTTTAMLSAAREYQAVGGLGIITIQRNPAIPPTEFFTPGRHFLARVRHSSGSDDAGTDIRKMEIKFADADVQGPLDIIALTGTTGVVWDLQSAYDYAELVGNRDDSKKVKEVMLRSPEHLRVLIESFRRAPDSYSDLRYHSQVPIEFKALDGVKRYAKFRVIPRDGRPESGRLTKEQQQNIWELKRDDEDARAKDYLREEYKTFLKDGPVEYTLQIQYHQVSNDDPWYILHPGRAWNEENHPWLDLADVTVTTPLPDDVTVRMKYDIGALPSSSLALLAAESGEEFRCANHILQAVSMATQGVQRHIAPKQPLTTYTVSVETGAQAGAGTNSHISIVLIGSSLLSQEVALGSWFRIDYRRGHVDTYQINTYDVGEILVVRLLNKGWLFGYDDWFVTKVIVTPENKEPQVFWVNRWVVDELVLYSGAATPPNMTQPAAVKAFRSIEAQKKQEQYQWASNDPPLNELPGRLAVEPNGKLPRGTEIFSGLQMSLAKGVQNAQKSMGLEKIRKIDKQWSGQGEFEELFDAVVEKTGLNHVINATSWKDDHVFGMQFMNGVNPLVLDRCDKFPENLAPLDGLVDDLLDRGKSLYREMKDGHIYKADYKILEEIPRHMQGSGKDKERYMAEPIALFYANKSGDLIPIAIQLYQKPGEGNPVWTPHDAPLDWLYAKMWLKNADIQAHQVIHRLLLTHVMTEPFTVATWRQLPSIHPVHRLLFSHMRNTLALNVTARNELIGKDGILAQTLSIGGGESLVQLMQKFYKKFNWEDMDVPNLLKRKGLDDKTKLQGYFYRDDALSLWNALKNFVREFLGVFYKSDKDVTDDTEIQAWLSDISTNGFPTLQGHQDHKFPNMIRTRYQLVHLLTCVIFNCTCQCAAVNSGQLEMSLFMPNAPCCLHLPPPTTKGVVDLETIMLALPTKKETAVHLGLMHVFSKYAEDEMFLGSYPGQFQEPEVSTIIERYQNELQKISESIRKRNEGLTWPYRSLLPEGIPNGITI